MGMVFTVSCSYLIESFCFFCFYSAGSGTQSLMSARQELYHQIHLQASFNLVLEMRVLEVRDSK